MTGLADTHNIPEPLRRFMARGGSVFRCDDGDWEVNIESPALDMTQSGLMPNSLIIANNGCGDYLFLAGQDASDVAAGSFDDRVFVYWHEGPEIEQFTDDLRNLTDPADPIPSPHAPVLYADRFTKVMIGDHVSARDLVLRKQGRVVYVPGVSKKNREFEHGGLAWVGIRFEGGAVSGAVVDPDSSCLKKNVRFLSRATSEVEEIGPLEAFD